MALVGRREQFLVLCRPFGLGAGPFAVVLGAAFPTAFGQGSVGLLPIAFFTSEGVCDHTPRFMTGLFADDAHTGSAGRFLCLGIGCLQAALPPRFREGPQCSSFSLWVYNPPIRPLVWKVFDLRIQESPKWWPGSSNMAARPFCADPSPLATHESM